MGVAKRRSGTEKIGPLAKFGLKRSRQVEMKFIEKLGKGKRGKYTERDGRGLGFLETVS